VWIEDIVVVDPRIEWSDGWLRMEVGWLGSARGDDGLFDGDIWRFGRGI